MKFFEDHADGLSGLIRSASAFFAAHSKKEKAIADRIAAETKATEEARAAAEEAAANAPPPPDPPPFRDRAGVISVCDLGPEHIIGSWFMAVEDGDVSMHGLVVAQIEARGQTDARYLLQMYSGQLEKKTKQVIVPQSRMLLGFVSEDRDRMGLSGSNSEWRFYDTEDDLKQAWYEFNLAEAKERV